MISIENQVAKAALLANMDELREKTKGVISEERLQRLVELGINPFNKDGSLKNRNCLSVMIWRYTHKDKWYKPKNQENEKEYVCPLKITGKLPEEQ